MIHRRDLLSLGAAAALGAALPFEGALARALAPRRLDARLEVEGATGRLTEDVELLWLHDAGVAIPLWTAKMAPGQVPSPAVRLDMPADRGVTLRLVVGARSREVRLTRWGRFEWPVGPEAHLAVALAPRAEEVLA